MAQQSSISLAPKGLEGLAVAETSIGDVHGHEGFYHYRQYSAVELAARRSFEDVSHLLLAGDLPNPDGAAAFAKELADLRRMPPGLSALLPSIAGAGSPLDVLRTSVSVLGAELGWRPALDTSATELADQAVQLCSVVPTVLAVAGRLRDGHEPLAPRSDLGFAANYLWMMSGIEPAPEVARAVEQYLILVIDHGFNASTFTARVITSTGADLASAICGAIGALSGPLHGGAPSRALDMLDEIGTPNLTESYVRRAVQGGDRIMGFGHRVYKTDDPRSVFLREVARNLDAPLLDFAMQVEQTVVETLAELKPGRELYANVEFYAGVVMDACGIPREMFTPTFACGRVVGWCAHALEQAADNRLIRPSAIYVGPSAPVTVPELVSA